MSIHELVSTHNLLVAVAEFCQRYVFALFRGQDEFAIFSSHGFYITYRTLVYLLAATTSFEMCISVSVGALFYLGMLLSAEHLHVSSAVLFNLPFTALYRNSASVKIIRPILHQNKRSSRAQFSSFHLDPEKSNPGKAKSSMHNEA